MVSAKINVEIEQGATFSMQASLNAANGAPIDTTVYTAKAQLRKSIYSANSYNFVIALSNGSIILSMSANTTALLEPGRYVYDAYLYGPSTTTRVIEGLATVTGEVTK